MMIDLQLFDTIIFDFGGVILDINPQNTIDEFLKQTDTESIQKIQEDGILDDMEKGQVSFTKLHERICTIIDKNLEYDTFLYAWNAILLDYKKPRIEWLLKLANTHKLYLLSNSNKTHYEKYAKDLKDQFNFTFEDLFDKAYFSHNMGLLKPDKEIYLQVLKEQNLEASKTLFIEDTEINAKAAEALGIRTLVIPRNGSFYDYFA